MKTKPVQKQAPLIQRIASGDRQAFDELVLTYQQRIINLAYRLLGDAAAAQDIAQDVFVQAYQNAGKFRGEASEFTWLYRITVNLASNYRRKRKWEKLFSVIDPEKMDFWRQDSRQQPDNQLEQTEQNRIIRKAIAKLPEAQRTALILHRWEGLSYKEIAEVTGWTLSAVESKIHRAYENLGKILPDLLEKRKKK